MKKKQNDCSRRVRSRNGYATETRNAPEKSHPRKLCNALQTGKNGRPWRPGTLGDLVGRAWRNFRGFPCKQIADPQADKQAQIGEDLVGNMTTDERDSRGDTNTMRITGSVAATLEAVVIGWLYAETNTFSDIPL